MKTNNNKNLFAPLRLCVRPLSPSVPSRLCVRPYRVTRTRRGISLLEILIATFVLAIGLLGLAALLPVGRFAIVETGKADRAGACGRAALRDVNVRRMLDYTTWSPPIGGGVTDVSPFVIDPLGYASTITVNLGGATGPISRMTLLSPATGIQYTLAEAEQVFTWQDDLVFDMPEDVTMRPSIMTTGLDSQGDYSWFLTVTPAANENELSGIPGSGIELRDKSLFSVSIVVCYKRDLGLDTGNNPTGEHVTVTPPPNPGVTFLGNVGYGGGSLKLTFSIPAAEVNMREGEWILLYGTEASGRTQCHWYRLANVGEIDPATPNDRYVSLIGPDWTIDTDGDANLDATAVVIQSVIGVYTTTMELD